MPFNPKVQTTPYTYRSSPVIPGSERLAMDREVRKMGEKVNELVRAVQEIQDYLKTLP